MTKNKAYVKMLFDMLKKAAENHSKLQNEFTAACQEYYGFSAHDHLDLLDNDVLNIPDTLDYGGGSLTFEQFDQAMKGVKANTGKEDNNG